MSVKTTTKWADDFNDEMQGMWHTSQKRLDFLDQNSDKCIKVTEIKGQKYGAVREWEDDSTAQAWKNLVETVAEEIGTSVTVTIE